MSKPTERSTERCPGPSYLDIMRADSTPVAKILAEKSNPPQSTADIPFREYVSREFLELEMSRLWNKVWQIACREEDIREVGDYLVYDIGDYSIIVVRTEDGIKAYHNSCLHRGTKLKPSGGSGWSPNIRCPFHGWTWELDGTLNEVPCSWEFKHLDYDANRLPEVRVETWNSFVFVNMDEGARPLLDYLEVLPEHFKNRAFTDWYAFIHIQKELNCNWKVAMEAFMEAYHTPVVHPELTQVVGDWNMQHDVLSDNVTRDLCPMGVSSPTVKVPLTQQQLLDRMFLSDPKTSRAEPLTVPEGKTARDVMAAQLRERMAKVYEIDLSGFSDAEVIDSLKYNLFPNALINGGITQRHYSLFKPLGTDPGRCIYEMIRLRPLRPGEERPEPPPVVRIREEELFGEVSDLDPFVASVMDQDTQIMRWQQEGMRASKKGAATLSTYQESRIRRVHETLSKYVYANTHEA
ncbi:MAG: SRPBCC family protein [Sphingomonadales bacterium]